MSTTITPGTRVKHDGNGFTGTVVPNTDRWTSVPDDGLLLIRPDNASELPLQTLDGLWSCMPHRVSVLSESAPTWKVGDIVRADDGTTGVATHIGDMWTTITHSDDRDTDYRHDRVAPLYPLTREELTTIDDGLRRGDEAGVDAALAATNQYLNPTVTRTFEVTVTQPADRPEVTVAGLTQVIGTLHSTATITVKETN